MDTRVFVNVNTADRFIECIGEAQQECIGSHVEKHFNVFLFQSVRNLGQQLFELVDGAEPARRFGAGIFEVNTGDARFVKHFDMLDNPGCRVAVSAFHIDGERNFDR
ncbi:hypothetical protein D3C87_1568050 [compost metagenome]